MSLTATIQAALRGEFSKVKGYGRASYLLNEHPIFGSLAFNFADGVGQGQADLFYVSHPDTPPSIAAATAIQIDFSGTTDDALGDDLAFGHIKALGFYADPTALSEFVIGGQGTNAWVGPFKTTTTKHDVEPSGLYLAVNPLDGWLVTPGTLDLFRIENTDAVNAAIYHMFVIGTSV